MNLNFKNAQVKRDIFDAVDFVRKAFNKEYEDYYPENYLPGDFADIPPLLIVKAEKDKVKGINKSIDKLISIAKARNLKFEYIFVDCYFRCINTTVSTCVETNY